MFGSYAICGFTTSSVIETHLMPYAAICGFGPVPGATAYGVLSGLNLVGMIAAGWLSNRVHRPLLLTVIYAVRAVSFLLLMFVADDYPRLIVFAVLLGLFDYPSVPVTASYIASRLGVKVLGPRWACSRPGMPSVPRPGRGPVGRSSTGTETTGCFGVSRLPWPSLRRRLLWVSETKDGASRRVRNRATRRARPTDEESVSLRTMAYWKSRATQHNWESEVPPIAACSSRLGVGR
jgi:hypothetical protein